MEQGQGEEQEGVPAELRSSGGGAGVIQQSQSGAQGEKGELSVMVTLSQLLSLHALPPGPSLQLLLLYLKAVKLLISA